MSIAIDSKGVAGWEEFQMSRSHSICLVVCKFLAITHGCVYAADHVRPIYFASLGVLHAAFCGFFD